MPSPWLMPLLAALVTAQPSRARPRPDDAWPVAHRVVPEAPRVAAAAPTDALVPDTASRDSVRTTHTPLFTRRDVWIAGAAVAATAVLMPADRNITEEFRDPWPQHSTLLRDVANDFNVVGSPGVLVASIGLYGLGRLGHAPRWAALGLYSTEAIAISGIATGAIKGLVGRARPYVNDNDPSSFALDRGFHNAQDTSFPSGHATAAFAAAAVVAGESQRWWPSAARYVAPAAYGTATLVALARLYSNKHWASDVVMGAGIGTLSGLAVVHFNEAHPNNLVNRWLLGTTVIPELHGAMLTWTIRTR